jgi:adenosine deaminase
MQKSLVDLKSMPSITVLSAAAMGVAVAGYLLWKRKSARRDLTTMPKVELHVHLDGAFDSQTLLDAAKRRISAGELPAAVAEQISRCGNDLTAFEALVSCRPEERSLKVMLDRFMLFLPIVQGDLQVIEELAVRFVERQAAQHVLYTEVRYSPHILTRGAAFEFSQSGERTASLVSDDEAFQVVEAVTRGLRRGCAEHPGTEVAQILCFIDGKPQWCDTLTRIASAAYAPDSHEKLPQCPVVAVDVAAGEAHFADVGGLNGKAHREAMCLCRQAGLGLTNHAGESGPTAHVAAAASAAYGSATRVGHGYAAVLEARAAAASPGGAAELVAALRKLGIPDALTMEVCPTSSRATGGVPTEAWTEHPAAFLTRVREAAEAAGDVAAAAALPRVTISSDDPAVFASSLTDELRIAAQDMRLSDDSLLAIMLNAADAAFLPAAGKTRLRSRILAGW